MIIINAYSVDLSSAWQSSTISSSFWFRLHRTVKTMTRANSKAPPVAMREMTQAFNPPPSSSFSDSLLRPMDAKEFNTLIGYSSFASSNGC